MTSVFINTKEKKLIRDLVNHYKDNIKIFDTFLNSFVPRITGNDELMEYVHSIKWRTKSLKSLTDKLNRKFIDLKNDRLPISYTKENLFIKINDLAGFRILYLYTDQFDKINEMLLRIFKDEKYDLIEGPEARVWDDEYRSIFNKKGITTTESGDNLYTSVHYVLNTRRQNEFTFEIQVRTLADELWGEVDHKLNYPHRTKNVSCSEQLKVLARLSSSCTRLVDSIFTSHESAKRRRK